MSYGSFELRLRLPSNVNTDDLKATYSDGVVEIVVPAAAKRSSQRVPVDVASQKKR